jgi:hypothetical protein
MVCPEREIQQSETQVKYRYHVNTIGYDGI